MRMSRLATDRRDGQRSLSALQPIGADHHSEVSDTNEKAPPQTRPLWTNGESEAGRNRRVRISSPG